MQQGIHIGDDKTVLPCGADIHFCAVHTCFPARRELGNLGDICFKCFKREVVFAVRVLMLMNHSGWDEIRQICVRENKRHAPKKPSFELNKQKTFGRVLKGSSRFVFLNYRSWQRVYAER